MALSDSFEPLIFKDNHTIFITGLEMVTEEELDKTLAFFFEACSKFYSESSNEKEKEYADPSKWSKWYINLVKGRDGPLGIAYVYFQNPAAYYAIVGKNLDGSHKLREADPGDYDDDQEIDSWDIPDVDSLKAKATEGKVLIVDDKPVVSFPSIEIVDPDEPSGGSGSSSGRKKMLVVPTIKACIAMLKPEKYETIIPNQLFTQIGMNNWLTAEMIKEHFSRFCSSKESRNKLNVIIEGGKVFVKFHPHYNDIHFALKMCQKTSFSYKDNECTLFFDYRKKATPSFNAANKEDSEGSGRGNGGGRGYRGNNNRRYDYRNADGEKGQSSFNTNWRKR